MFLFPPFWAYFPGFQQQSIPCSVVIKTIAAVSVWNPGQALSWNPRHAQHQREILSCIPWLFAVFVSRIPSKQQNSLPMHCNDSIHGSSNYKWKTRYYKVNDTNTLIHIFAHSYHPDIAELIPQTNYAWKYNTESVTTHQFLQHQVYVTESITKPITSSLYNVQPTSHTSKPRIFPSLPKTQ